MKTEEKQIGHTPGPWQIIELKISGLSEPVIESGKQRVCTFPALTDVGGQVNVRAVEIACNVNLIAAAPELLEACKACLPDWGEEDDGDGLDGTASHEISLGDLRKLRAAIKKATGGAR